MIKSAILIKRRSGVVCSVPVTGCTCLPLWSRNGGMSIAFMLLSSEETSEFNAWRSALCGSEAAIRPFDDWSRRNRATVFSPSSCATMISAGRSALPSEGRRRLPTRMEIKSAPRFERRGRGALSRPGSLWRQVDAGVSRKAEAGPPDEPPSTRFIARIRTPPSLQPACVGTSTGSRPGFNTIRSRPARLGAAWRRQARPCVTAPDDGPVLSGAEMDDTAA